MSDTQTTTPVQETVATEEATPKKKRIFLDGFMKFLMYGGFMVILILGIVIAVIISSVFNCK